MKNRQQLLGRVIDGYWEIVKAVKTGNSRNYNYILRNQYNGTEVQVGGTTVRSIIKGETSVSKIVSRRIKKGERRNG